MKIRSSHYRLPRSKPETIEQPPDPAKIAHEQRMKELSERKAMLYEKIAALEAKLGYDTDWLIYLPRAAGSPEFMQRACRYLENFRARVEAAGAKVWLCADHDFVRRAFVISKFREIDGQVFCSGNWTHPKYRELYKGVSPDNATFAGDVALLEQLAARQSPEGTMTVDDLPEHTRAAARSDAILGLAGAACLNNEPGYGRTEIYRMKG
jgi:hypothetical protein